MKCARRWRRLSLRLELMQRTMPDLPDAAKASIGIMRKHVAQESLMVNDLIDASRTLTGQMSIERQPVSLGQVLRDAVSTVEINAHDKHITLQVTPADYGASIVHRRRRPAPAAGGVEPAAQRRQVHAARAGASCSTCGASRAPS